MKSIFNSRIKVNLFIISLLCFGAAILTLNRAFGYSSDISATVLAVFLGLLTLLLSFNRTIILTDEKIISRHPVLGLEKSIAWEEIKKIEEREFDTRSNILSMIIFFLLFGWLVWLFYGSKVTVTKIVSTEYMEIIIRNTSVKNYDLLVETLIEMDNEKNALRG